MEFINKDTIKLGKVINKLDKLALNFTSILNKLEIKYVIVSGYVPILFGRNRASEDIDLIVERLNFITFKTLWNKLCDKFECINIGDVEEAYKEYLLTGHALRFAEKGKFIPNIEFKFPKVELDVWTLKERKKVIVNKEIIFISPLELQIPFKLFLGTEKDIEDAKYLYNLFKEYINNKLLKEFNRKLEIDSLFNKYLEKE